MSPAGVRLTDVERRERALGGDELVEQIAKLAVLLGWDWLHVGALRTKFGWKTPTRGTLARWPDLTLVRTRDRRLIFAECKRELEPVRPEQEAVLEVLRSLEFDASCGNCPHVDRRRFPATPEGYAAWYAAGRPETRHECCPLSVEIHVWRPSDLRGDRVEDTVIGQVLR